MAEATILFNGIKYSFAVVEKAFTWARLNKGKLKAIFLRAKKEPAEGYIIPSDLDAAENLTSTDDAKSSHIAIIESNMRMLEHAAAAEHADIQTTVLIDPSKDDLIGMLEESERIFASEDIVEQGIMTVDSINLKKFIADPPAPVELIKSNT
jgi:hypothetical protein